MDWIKRGGPGAEQGNYSSDAGGVGGVIQEGEPRNPLREEWESGR